MTGHTSWLTCFALARRDLRGGLRGFRIFLACLTLGVLTIAALGSLAAMLQAGIASEGRAILGGDIELSLVQRQATDEERALIADLGSVSEVATLRALARASDGETPALIEIKAVDELYPLIGSLSLAEERSLHAELAQTSGNFGIVVDDTLLIRLDVGVGDLVRIGAVDLEVRGTITHEPDRLGSGFVFGPRVLMSMEALAATELVQPGSLVRWRYRVDLGSAASSEQELESLIDQVRSETEEAGWRIRGRTNAAPNIERFIERLSFFMTLAGLTALIVGGVGIANAVRNYLETRTDTIATFKCLGASSGTIFRIYLLQILILAGIATSAALLLGALLPVAGVTLLGDLIPVPVSLGFYWQPLAVAAAFGILITLAFTVWPLGRARDVPGAVLFRSIIAPLKRWPPLSYLAAIAAAIIAAAVLAFMWYPDARITAFYVACTFASFMALWLLALALMAFVRRYVRGATPQTRLAFRNVHRPGTPAPSIVLSLGLGLALMVTLALIDTNMSRELNASIPERAPSFFFVDIQTDQVEPFRETIWTEAEDAEIDLVPMLRGRITQVDGVPASEVDAPPEVQWALRGDRGLTYEASLPEGSRLVAGEWWQRDYEGPPLVSVEAEIARGLGLDIGDKITVNVLGRDLTAEVANLRSVEWESVGINFVLVYSPAALRGAPHAHLATVTMQTELEEQVLRSVNATFPNITAIRVKDAIDLVSDLLGRLLTAIRGASLVSLAMSVLVLAGALASGYRARMYDAAVFKTLGATRMTVLSSHVVEYATYGAVTSLFALLAGSAAAYAVVAHVMELPWSFDPAVAVVTVIGAVIVTLALGLATSWRTLGAKPARILRAN